MSDDSRSKKEPLIIRWGAAASALTAILTAVFMLFPRLKPTSPSSTPPDSPPSEAIREPGSVDQSQPASLSTPSHTMQDSKPLLRDLVGLWETNVQIEDRPITWIYRFNKDGSFVDYNLAQTGCIASTAKGSFALVDEQVKIQYSAGEYETASVKLVSRDELDYRIVSHSDPSQIDLEAVLRRVRVSLPSPCPQPTLTGRWVGGIYPLDQRDQAMFLFQLVVDTHGKIDPWKSYAKDATAPGEDARPISAGHISTERGLYFRFHNPNGSVGDVTGAKLEFVDTNTLTIDGMCTVIPPPDELRPTHPVRLPVIVRLERPGVTG